MKATNPGINNPRNIVDGKDQNGFQNQGTTASPGASPTL